LEGQLETATQDFNFLNDMLKEQLPYFFQLRSHFIDPIFQAFYNVQIKIYLSMWQRIHQIVEENPDHFETIQYGIQDGYEARQQSFNAREALEHLELLEKNGKSWRGGMCTTIIIF
jgi:amphiphysin